MSNFKLLCYNLDMKYLLVIFDLDGTLLDTLGDLHTATNLALSDCGYPPRTFLEVRAFIGNGVKNLMRRAATDGLTELDTERLFQKFLVHYEVQKNLTTKPYPGVVEMINELKQNGIKTAVLSNKYDVAVKQLCTNWLPMLDYAQGATDDIQMKPSPDGIFYLLRHFALNAKDALVVGDAETDMAAADAAGVDKAAVTWGARDKQVLAKYLPNFLVDSAEALLRKILD